MLTSTIFFGKDMFEFVCITIFRNTTSLFVFSGQMSLKTIAELLKNAPVLLKRFRKHRSQWEQYLPYYAYMIPTVYIFL